MNNNPITFFDKENEAYQDASKMMSEKQNKDFIIKVSKTNYGNFCVEKIPKTMSTIMLEHLIFSSEKNYEHL